MLVCKLDAPLLKELKGFSVFAVSWTGLRFFWGLVCIFLLNTCVFFNAYFKLFWKG
jgi:hypothetical protein